MIDGEDRDDEFDLEDIEDGSEDEETLTLAEEHDDDPPPEKKPLTKAQRDFINLRKRAQSAEDRATRAEEAAAKASGGVDVLTRTFQQPRVDPREEQERIAQMSEREYADYRLSQERTQIQAAFAQQGFQSTDLVDSLKFERLTDKNPAYAQIADEVETRLTKLRSQGQNVDRKTIANLILGEKAAAKALRPKKEVKDDTRRMKVSGGNDVPSGSERTKGKGKTAKERLDNITF